MTNIFPIDFEEKNDIANNDFILFSDSEDWNKLKKAQYSNLKWEKGDTWARINSANFSWDDIVFWETDWNSVTLSNAKTTLTWPQGNPWSAATITVGTTTTWAAGTNASVTNSGTSSAAVLNFTIPKWADGENPNAKLFTLSSTSDLTTAQSAYDWYLAGNYPVLKYGSKFYYLYSAGSSALFWVVSFDKAADSSSTTWLYRDWIQMTLSSWTITAITTTTVFVANSNFLRTGYNYPTPYTPEYDWSPATKKYVDDWLSTKANTSSLWTAAACNTWTSSWNVPVLDSNWKLNKSTLPWVALTDTFTVSTSSDLTSLSSAEQWDLAIVTTENKTYVLASEPYSTAANWKEILSPTGWVTSVNGQTWAVTVSEFTPWGTATTGYVVKKTASWYEWAAESWAVTSVNWNTWAVTVSEFNATNWAVKVFDMPAYWDDISDILTWISSWGSVVLSETSWTTTSLWGNVAVDTNNLVLTTFELWTSSNTKKSFTYNSSNIVTSTLTSNSNYFAPWGTATTWYVVTKTAGGYEWAAPTGWSSTITVTLLAANRSSKSITVSATGVTASNTVIVSPAPANINDYALNSIYCSAQGSGTLTFSCNTEPTVDIDVNVLIMS